MTLSFKCNATEAEMIGRIVDRAEARGLVSREFYSRMTAVMDLIACHANGCPMDFGALLEADNFTFTHDVAGIAGHIDRETGELRDCFLPRTADRTTR